MAIKSNVGIGPTDALTTDTIIYQPAAIDRYAVGAFNLHNTTGGEIIVSVYVSPDLTSASGKRVGLFGIPAGGEVDVNSVVGEGYTVAQNIIASADFVGSNATITVTQYTDGD